MEGYFTNTSRFERPKRAEHEIFHLTMLAETDEGYRNLIKITSKAFLDGYYYKPRTDWELLERHHEGITATSGCLGGLVPQLILAGEERPRSRRPRGSKTCSAATTSSSSSRTTASKTTCGSSSRCSRSPAGCRRRCSPPTTATTRTRKTPRPTTRCCACRPAALKTDAKRFKFDGDDFYIKSAAEMRDMFRELPDACDNTLLIAERADVDDRVRPDDPAVVPRATGSRRELVPPRAHDAGCTRALR